MTKTSATPVFLVMHGAREDWFVSTGNTPDRDREFFAKKGWTFKEFATEAEAHEYAASAK